MRIPLIVAGFLSLFVLCACETDIGHPPVDTTEYGSIAVTTTDTSLHAAIFIDNTATGQQTPSVLEKVPVGRHVVRLFLPCYKPDEDSIVTFVVLDSIHNDTFNLVFVESDRALSVVSEPAGATVFLDGLPLGHTPYYLSCVEPGPHALSLRKNSCVEVDTTISIEDGVTTTVSRGLSILGKTPLIENFSNTSCVPCVEPDHVLDTFLVNYGVRRRTSIGYHVNFPGPNDPMYLLVPGDNTQRRTYYSISSVPFIAIDGQKIYQPLVASTLDDSIRNRLYPQSQQSPAVLMDVWSTSNMDTLKGEIHIRALQGVSATMTVAVIEREIIYASPPGTNGQTRFTDVFRGYFEPSGQSVVLSVGDTLMAPYAIPRNAAWGQTDIVVFLQSGSEILQSAWTVYP